MNLFGFTFTTPWDAPAIQGPQIPTLSVDDLPSASSNGLQPVPMDWAGDKFWGGFGETKLFSMNYWELRKRSAQLFTENLYARGLIRRLVTNEINTGLCLESVPDETTLGLKEGSLNEWAEDVERRYELWGANPAICDYLQESTLPKLQKTIRREALIEGDILVVMRQDPDTMMPSVQLVSGSSVRTPWLDTGKKFKINKSHSVKYGVEKDAKGRIVAFWIEQELGDFKRLPAFAPKSGRRMAWLVYGTDKRKDEVRGEPLLSIILQSLKEIDRYRDSVQRKAVIESIMALFIEKGENKPGTQPMTQGAVRKDSVTPSDNGAKSTTRQIDVAAQIPGFIAQELQQGEKPHAFKPSGSTLEFGTFESAVIHAIAWANEVPPEILELAFSNNYSASQAAINEFKIYLNSVRQDFGQSPCQYVYIEWLLSEALLRKIDAPGLLEAWRDPLRYEEFGAWVAADWSGAIKPSTDILKQAKGYEKLEAKGWVTNGRASRELTGTKFEKNIKKITRERELLVKAMEPLAKFRQQYPESAELVNDALSAINGHAKIDLDEIVQRAAMMAIEQMAEEQPEPVTTGDNA